MIRPRRYNLVRASRDFSFVLLSGTLSQRQQMNLLESKIYCEHGLNNIDTASEKLSSKNFDGQDLKKY